jgi:hypothetical protein
MRIRQILRITLALGVAVTALTTAGWAQTTECHSDKYKIRYYPSEVDTYHSKRVIAYCDPDYKAISCEAKVYVSSEHAKEQNQYFVALNELYEYRNSSHSDPYYQRSGCYARANTFQANYDDFHWDPNWEEAEESQFYWALQVYATCVPQHCVETKKGDGSYQFYDHEPEPEPEPEPEAR